MATGIRLMKSVLTALPKRVLLPFGLSAGMSAADAAIQKKKKKKKRKKKKIMDQELHY